MGKRRMAGDRPQVPYRGRSLMVFPKPGLWAAWGPLSFSWCVSEALMAT